MSDALDPPHHDLNFMTPLGEQRAGTLVDFLAAELAQGTVVDVACGWGELLLRTVERAPESQGLGIDLDEEALSHGRTLADQRGLGGRVELSTGDAAAALPSQAEAVICIGASQVWGPEVEDCEPLDYASALKAIRAIVSPGRRVVFGEAIWGLEPTPAAMAPLAGRADEFVGLPELLEIAVDAGFQPVQVHEASQTEWDEFESGYAACYARWLATHAADHPDAVRMRERAAAQRSAYFGGYRGVLGLAYLALVAI